MTILNRYVAGGFLLIFGMAVAVFAFVMGIGSVIKLVDLVARGVSAPALLRYFALSFPFILQYAIPMSVMTATLLLFTRLSMDGEISAMKACGMSLWQIVAPVVMAAALISGVSLYISNWLSPESRFAQRRMVNEFSKEDPLLLVEQGRWIRGVPNLMVYIGSKKGTNLSDIVIYQYDENTMRTSIRARAGTVGVSADGRELVVDMVDVRMEQPDRKDPANPAKAQIMVAEYYPQRIDIAARRQASTLNKRPRDMTLPELMVAYRNAAAPYLGLELPPETVRDDRMKTLVEINSRMAMSFSCFAMTLIGIPLGMRSKRRESSIGVLMSLLVIFCFYLFVMVAKSMAGNPALHPDLFVWIPVVAAEAGGLWLIRRMS
ncbi:MAG: YjgP/YjgQ family permease [Lentisphaerae bacterium]|nr:YjgP/YjgQ family permease [Lentisphaerota bacterium]